MNRTMTRAALATIVAFAFAPPGLTRPSASAPSTASAEDTRLVLSAPITSADACLYCSSCTSEAGHKATGAPAQGNAWGIMHQHCSVVGTCQGGHFHYPTTCDGFSFSPSELTEMWYAVLDGEQDFDAIFGRYDGRLHVNAERKALQVLGCSGTVVAHIPLTDDQLTLLLGD